MENKKAPTSRNAEASTNLISPDQEALLRGDRQQHRANQGYPSKVHAIDGEDTTCVSSVTTYLRDMPIGMQLYPSVEEVEEQAAKGGGELIDQKAEPPAVSPSQEETTLQSMEAALLMTKENERKARHQSKENEKDLSDGATQEGGMEVDDGGFVPAPPVAAAPVAAAPVAAPNDNNNGSAAVDIHFDPEFLTVSDNATRQSWLELWEIDPTICHRLWMAETKAYGTRKVCRPVLKVSPASPSTNKDVINSQLVVLNQQSKENEKDLSDGATQEGRKVCRHVLKVPPASPSTNKDAIASELAVLNQPREFQIQPLPRRRVRESTPGAHRVAGPGLSPRPRTREPQCDRETVTDTDSSSMLVDEAFLVAFNENDNDMETGGSSTQHISELFEGTALPTKEPQNPSHSWVIPCSVLRALLVAALIAGILLAIFLPRGKDDSTPTPANSSGVEANSIQYHPFQEDLPPFLLKDIKETGSPLYLANIWMWNDPHLNAYSVQRQQQRFYLASLYYATNGDHWLQNDHWLSYNISECEWFSSHSAEEYEMPFCDEDDHVISLSLASNNLTGTLTPHHPIVPLVHTIDFADNHLEGTIPSFQSSAHLEVLILSNNDLIGGVVGQGVMALDRLRVAKVNGNHLEGHYSSDILPLVLALEIFHTTDNLFGGHVASEIGLCKNLTHYLTGENLVTGILPSELGLLTNLEEISVAGSASMTGTIPEELGHLSKLVLLDVSGTWMTGPVPESICVHAEEGRLDVVANCSRIQCCP